MRVQKDWSAVQAHEALHEGLGLAPKSKASYSALEDGKAPSPSQEAFLRKFFGSGPTDADRDPSAGASSSDTSLAPAVLVKALADQTAAITRLAEAIEALVEGQPTPEDLIELVKTGLLGSTGAGVTGGGTPAQ